MTRADWLVGGVSLLAIALNIGIALQAGQEIEFGRAFAVIAGILLIFVIATAFFEVSLAKRARAASFRLCPRCLHDLSGGVAHEMKDETETTMTCPECAWSVRTHENSELWRKFVESPLPQTRMLNALMQLGGRDTSRG